jgi:hypothetical protein
MSHFINAYLDVDIKMIKSESNSLVYIIISIILLVISTIGKNKNKKHTPLPSEGVPTPQTSWSKELEDIFGKIAEEKPIDPKDTHEKEKPVEEIQKRKVTPKPASDIAFHVLNNEHEELFSERIIPIDEHEMRKAIIYSEILNRKYFLVFLF